MPVPYLTAVAGPTSHSPPPIYVAASTAPGPITFMSPRSPNGGGAGRSAVPQGGSSPWGESPGFTRRSSQIRGAPRQRMRDRDEGRERTSAQQRQRARHGVGQE